MSRSSLRSSIRTRTAASDDANRSRFSATSLPDNPAPMMAIRLIASSFSPRFVVLLVVVLNAKTQLVRSRSLCRDNKGFWHGVHWDGKTASCFALEETYERKASKKLFTED